MSPRLRQLTEQRAHSAYWQALGFLIVAVHAVFGTVALAKAGSMWGALVAALALFTIRLFWSAFKRADIHFAAIEQNNLSLSGAWQRPKANPTNPRQEDAANL